MTFTAEVRLPARTNQRHRNSEHVPLEINVLPESKPWRHTPGEVVMTGVVCGTFSPDSPRYLPRTKEDEEPRLVRVMPRWGRGERG
jgi:hypothetical protein